jgi:hypothetical protein
MIVSLNDERGDGVVVMVAQLLRWRCSGYKIQDPVLQGDEWLQNCELEVKENLPLPKL